MALSEKQARFAQEYLIDLNATQAAIRAGYSKNGAEVQGHRLLRDANVMAAIAESQEKRAIRTEITQDRVLRELAKIGFADMRKLLRWTGNQPRMDVDAAEESGEVEITAANFVRLFDSAELDDDTVGAIAEISQTKDGCLKVKLHDKRAALVDIGKHLGMFKEQVQIDAKHAHTLEQAGLPEVLGWLEAAVSGSEQRPH